MRPEKNRPISSQSEEEFGNKLINKESIQTRNAYFKFETNAKRLSKHQGCLSSREDATEKQSMNS